MYVLSLLVLNEVVVVVVVFGSLTGNVGAPTDSYHLFQLRNAVEIVWPLVLFIILVAVRNRQNYGATNIPESK